MRQNKNKTTKSMFTNHIPVKIELPQPVGAFAMADAQAEIEMERLAEFFGELDGDVRQDEGLDR